MLRACATTALVLWLAAPARPDGPTAIPWRTNFERARAEARAEGRPLWVQFTGPWCTYCRKMESDTFSKAPVVAAARDSFVPVKVQADEREDLVERLEVGGLPATLVLSASGAVLARHEGYASVAEFLAFLDRARGVSRSARPAKRSAEGEGLALAGYCPVSLVQGRGLTPGQQDLAVHYDGHTFRFADAEVRDAFLRQPEAFLPANGGRCPVRAVDRGEQVPGDPRFGVYYRNRLYLCADDEARRRFARDPGRYCDADLADRGFCPHCRNLAGRLVPGLPEFAATHGGRRYLFPDRIHLEAFRASPEKFLR
jgi:YHS domain-containing protein/thiol-disulfide isomerase/thioredoxin